MTKFKFDCKGFIFIEVLFLTLILSFTALMIVNFLETAMLSNRMSAIRNAAIYLANARMSEIEEYVDTNKKFPPSSYTILNDEDLTCENFFGINDNVKFEVDAQISGTASDKGNVTVKVTWTVGNNSSYGNGTNYEEIIKDIWIAPENLEGGT